MEALHIKMRYNYVSYTYDKFRVWEAAWFIMRRDFLNFSTMQPEDQAVVSLYLGICFAISNIIFLAYYSFDPFPKYWNTKPTHQFWYTSNCTGIQSWKYIKKSRYRALKLYWNVPCVDPRLSRWPQFRHVIYSTLGGVNTGTAVVWSYMSFDISEGRADQLFVVIAITANYKLQTR